MKRDKLLEDIARLKRKHKSDRSLARPFPDLSLDHNVAPTSDRVIGSTFARAAKPEFVSNDFTVGHFHKQGYCVVSKSELPWAGGKKT